MKRDPHGRLPFTVSSATNPNIIPLLLVDRWPGKCILHKLEMLGSQNNWANIQNYGWKIGKIHANDQAVTSEQTSNRAESNNFLDFWEH